VNELTERLGASPYNVSKRLKILEHAGIVEKSREGKSVRCEVVPAFRQQLARNKNQLDLGCCTFRFEKPAR
jgi:DNA-binding transcriptional ArsR family regulator